MNTEKMIALLSEVKEKAAEVAASGKCISVMQKISAMTAGNLLSCLSGSELEYTRTNSLIFKENKAVLVCHPYFGRGG